MIHMLWKILLLDALTMRVCMLMCIKLGGVLYLNRWIKAFLKKKNNCMQLIWIWTHPHLSLVFTTAMELQIASSASSILSPLYWFCSYISSNYLSKVWLCFKYGNTCCCCGEKGYSFRDKKCNI
ncbi:hypothetical protein ACSBR2_015598 [Camellia fascicularis]